MKLALQTVICCCVFTTVLPLVEGATEELNTSLKKRLKVWLHGRMKRDLRDSLLTADELCAEILNGPQQGDTENNVSPSPSTGLDNRPRRSASSKSAGCVLITCSYHDLLYKLHQLNSKVTVSAPKDKLDPTGYGRRRRSLLDGVQLALKTGRERRGATAGHRVHRFRSKRTVA
ncbi:ADM-like [Xyrichtys novacula]|uniref:ADM-like n=1 Tax=Xyrichtys novacula TaxID=13765 RepID=A0AAV1F5B1_XYRNO|nr:ADM-like [Xyrichtys novacula]